MQSFEITSDKVIIVDPIYGRKVSDRYAAIVDVLPGTWLGGVKYGRTKELSSTIVTLYAINKTAYEDDVKLLDMIQVASIFDNNRKYYSKCETNKNYKFKGDIGYDLHAPSKKLGIFDAEGYWNNVGQLNYNKDGEIKASTKIEEEKNKNWRVLPYGVISNITILEKNNENEDKRKTKYKKFYASGIKNRELNVYIALCIDFIEEN